MTAPRETGACSFFLRETCAYRERILGNVRDDRREQMSWGSHEVNGTCGPERNSEGDGINQTNAGAVFSFDPHEYPIKSYETFKTTQRIRPERKTFTCSTRRSAVDGETLPITSGATIFVNDLSQQLADRWKFRVYFRSKLSYFHLSVSSTCSRPELNALSWVHAMLAGRQH